MSNIKILHPQQVANIERLAGACMHSEIADDGDTMSAIGRMTPLAIIEMCQCWREARGMVRKPDCVTIYDEAATA